ncbi:hypothetical protein JCM13591A_03560 [Microbacterium xylanilyticum]
MHTAAVTSRAQPKADLYLTRASSSSVAPNRSAERLGWCPPPGRVYGTLLDAAPDPPGRVRRRKTAAVRGVSSRRRCACALTRRLRPRFPPAPTRGGTHSCPV